MNTKEKFQEFREKLPEENVSKPFIVESHSCRTTHSACDCVLKRMNKLEDDLHIAKHKLWKIKEALNDPTS